MNGQMVIGETIEDGKLKYVGDIFQPDDQYYTTMNNDEKEKIEFFKIPESDYYDLSNFRRINKELKPLKIIEIINNDVSRARDIGRTEAAINKIALPIKNKDYWNSPKVFRIAKINGYLENNILTIDRFDAGSLERGGGHKMLCIICKKLFKTGLTIKLQTSETGNDMAYEKMGFVNSTTPGYNKFLSYEELISKCENKITEEDKNIKFIFLSNSKPSKYYEIKNIIDKSS